MVKTLEDGSVVVNLQGMIVFRCFTDEAQCPGARSVISFDICADGRNPRSVASRRKATERAR